MPVSTPDPTRTTTLRRSFEREMTYRFGKLAKEVNLLITGEDAFGLTNNSRLTANYRWQFMSSPQQIQAFKLWLAQQIDNKVFSSAQATGQDWMEEYVKQGFTKGQERSFNDVRKPAMWRKRMDFYNGTREEFMRSSFMRPVAIEKVKILAGRVFSELEGITEAMSQQITRALIDGLTQGMSPRQITSLITDKVHAIGKERAKALARTEIIRAHAEGQLHSLEELGVEEVGVAVEMATAGDYKVCQKCKKLNGIVLTLAEARGLLPVHPNCRCAFLPANVGEDHRGQKRSYSSIKNAIEQSLKQPKQGHKLKKPVTYWKGKISKKRPKELV